MRILRFITTISSCLPASLPGLLRFAIDATAAPPSQLIFRALFALQTTLAASDAEVFLKHPDMKGRCEKELLLLLLLLLLSPPPPPLLLTLPTSPSGSFDGPRAAAGLLKSPNEVYSLT